jgi:nucleoside-diphosphate-sugar epimerase
MRVFVAGASGAIGTGLVPQLIQAGHGVIGTARSPAKAAGLKAPGAEPVALDLLDAEAVVRAVTDAKPDAIVHQATALADTRFGRNLGSTFAQTNRLRTAGTDALLAAAPEAGVRRFVAPSFASAAFRAEPRIRGDELGPPRRSMWVSHTDPQPDGVRRDQCHVERHRGRGRFERHAPRARQDRPSAV